jgi:hypothetical protein
MVDQSSGQLRRLLIIRHQSPLRVADEGEPLSAFDSAELQLPRGELVLDTRPLAEDVEGGFWRSSDEWVRRTADNLRAKISTEGGDAHYFGIAEVPHVLGLAAHLGDEILVQPHDYDRDAHSWRWPSDARALTMEMSGAPTEFVSQSGEAVLVVEVSYPVSQADVEAVVGSETLASIRIRPTERNPAPTIVRSPDDVRAVRERVRDALAAIAQNRPGVTLIHLFIAAPMSVTFAVGQELRLRNGRDVQTYRYRSSDAAERYKPALLLTARGMTGATRQLATEHQAQAAELRSVCRGALEDVKAHAAMIPNESPWYSALEPKAVLAEVAPFRTLSPLSQVVDQSDRFSDGARDRDYALPKDRPRTWEMSDSLVLDFYSGANKDPERMRSLARLFFYHEYLHDWQDLTKYTAEDVGSFANCLEAIDYMADTYALLHQLDRAIRGGHIGDENDQQQFLADQIGLAIASFWAFEPAPPHHEWQERRLRRYLNWYWRRVQIRDAPDLRTALTTLARRPSIEIAGFKYRTGGGRHYVLLNEPRPGDVPEIGLVLEDGRFTRRGTTTDLGIEALMRAFGEQDRPAIDVFFNSLMEHTKQTGGAFAAP